MTASRYPWIDWLKALGIFLVVAGHTYLPEASHRWIYAFHMPLFFMISGFLISPGGFDFTLKEFFARRVWKLVRLYLIFAFLGAMFYCYQFRHDQGWMEMIRGRFFSILYASSSHNDSRDLYPLVLWFFPALISGLLLLFAGWKIRPWWGKAGVFASLTIFGFSLSGKALPWELESGFVAAGFLVFGHAVRICEWDRTLIKAGKWSWPLMILSLLMGSFIALLNQSSLDIRLAHAGNGFFAFCACLMLIVAFTELAMKLPASRIVEAVAAATIFIFPLHTLVFPYADRVAVKLPVIRDGLSSGTEWYGWGKAGCVLALLTLVHFTCSRIKGKWLPATRS